MAFRDGDHEETSPELDMSLDMREEDQQQLMAFLRCASCRDLADEAVETLCCRALLCSGCLGRLNRVCPTCGRGCSDAPNHLARRLVGCQPWRCGHCGLASTRSEAVEHNRLCPKQRRRCPAPGCEFAGLVEAFLDHLVTAHGPQLLRRAGRLFGGSGPAPSAAGNGGAAAVAAAAARALQLRQLGEPIGWPGVRRLYTAGLSSRDQSRTFAAVTGKSYCGRELNGRHCDCCDGHCGPNNGCNCVDCMRRDLETFRVGRGQRALVNREGVIARLSQETGRFYCGRPNMGHDRSTDGFCGPSNGNNCHACGQLDVQARDRYASIVSSWT